MNAVAYLRSPPLLPVQVLRPSVLSWSIAVHDSSSVVVPAVYGVLRHSLSIPFYSYIASLFLKSLSPHRLLILAVVHI